MAAPVRLPRRGQIRSIEEAVPTDRQHKRPCIDCPWARASYPGWLGGLTADQWLAQAHGEARIDCHTLKGPQCAGAAIYRSNVCKSPRDRSLLLLPANKKRVFGSIREFREHHSPLLKDG